MRELNQYRTHDFKKALRSLRNKTIPSPQKRIQRHVENKNLRHTNNNTIVKGDHNEFNTNEKYYGGTQTTRYVH